MLSDRFARNEADKESRSGPFMVPMFISRPIWVVPGHHETKIDVRNGGSWYLPSSTVPKRDQSKTFLTDTEQIDYDAKYLLYSLRFHTNSYRSKVSTISVDLTH